ncbi:hypothetical protein [Kingella oralis]|uniref:hypothetical protein n=1 Tax=Kingella oralis TaxID=505 RepID=UPI0034E5CF6E
MAHFSPIQQTVRGKATHSTPSPTRHDYFQAAFVIPQRQPENIIPSRHQADKNSRYAALSVCSSYE